MKITITDRNKQNARLKKFATTDINSKLSNAHTVVDKQSGSFNAGSKEQLRTAVRNYLKNKAAMDKNIRLEMSSKAGIQDKAAEVANAIYETVLKSGLARKALKYCPHVKGTDMRIDVKYNSSYGVAAVGPQTVQPVYLSDKKFYPTPVTISDNLMITGVVLNTSSGDILQEKQEEGINAVRIKEDRLFKKSLDTALSLAPSGMSTISVGSLTPTILASLFAKIRAYNLQVSRAVMAANVQDDLFGDAFTKWFSQYDKYTIVQTGTIGNLLGAEIETDGYLDPEQHVLESGEIYALTEPKNLGGISDLGEIEATPVDGANRGVNGKGLFISEIMAMLVYNFKGIAKTKVVK